MNQSPHLAALSRFSEQQPKPAVIIVGIIATLAVMGLDYGLAAGLGLALALPYLVPVFGLAWFLGWPAAIVAAIVSACFHFSLHAFLVPPPGMSPLSAIVNGTVFALAIAAARGVSTLRLMLEYYLRGPIWRANQRPIQITPRIRIVPGPEPAQPPPPDGAPAPVSIRMSPGMAFGTGSHPTTQMCLGLLEAHLQPGDSVLDIGSGTGVLSIAAVQLGSGRVLAIDFDPEAERATRENVHLNGVGGQIEVRFGSLEVVANPKSQNQSPQFQTVLGNLLTHVILELFEQNLAGVVAPGGRLILSGIRHGEADQVRAAAEAAGLQIVEQREHSDWVALLARKI